MSRDRAGAPPALTGASGSTEVGSPERRVAVVDLLDRVLAGGVALSGEVTSAVADVDLVHVSPHA